MKILRYIIPFLMACSAVAQTQLQIENQTGNLRATNNSNRGFNSARTHNFLSGAAVTFNAGSTLTLNGTLAGTPTGGVLNLSLLTLTLPTGVGLPSQTGHNGKYLTTNGTTASWATVATSGGDALVANPLSQFAATTSAQLRSVLSDENGLGNILTDTGDGSGLTNLDAGNIGIGTLLPARGGSGAGTLTGILQGNGTSAFTATAGVTPGHFLAYTGGSSYAFGAVTIGGIANLGTGVSNALQVNIGSAGAPVLVNGVLGTPSSGTVTNLTGTASININGTVGATTPTTGAFTTVTLGGNAILSGDALSVLALRNSTAGQTLNVYGTYTDASNYSRLALRGNAYGGGPTVFALTTQIAGSAGSDADFYIGNDSTTGNFAFRSGGSTRWAIQAGGTLIAWADNTYDIGASGATRPRSIYVGTNGTFGGTVAATTLTGAAGGVTLDASGFNGNLATTDNTLQEVAQKVDDLVVGVPTTITVADTTDTTSFVALFESATGDLAPKTDGGILYNASTGMLTVTGLTATTAAFTTFNVTDLTVSGTFSPGSYVAAVASGGTGRATSTTAYGLIAAGTTATGAHQTLAAGATAEILVGGGASALPVWTTASGTGAPARVGAPTFTSSITAGVAGGTTGSILLKGTTSGTVTLTTAAAAGTYSLTLPTDDGTTDQVLKTDGAGVLSWTTPATPTLTSTRIGYGDGSNLLTGEAAFAYNATTNIATIGGVSLGAGSEVSTIGPLVDNVDGTTPLNNINQVVAAGTAYTLTASYASVDFGTTDPVLTIANAGTYAIYVNIQFNLVGATYATYDSVTAKLRRTNNTAADLTGSTFGTFIPTITTITAVGPQLSIGPIKYTTSATDDLITVQATLNSTPSVGSVTASAVTITAIRAY